MSDILFGGAAQYAAARHPTHIAVQDLNADGVLDLAVSNSGSNTVSILLGYGDGTFRPRIDVPTTSGQTYVSIADLNADGRPDLVVANGGSTTVSVMLGTGTG